MSVFDEYYARVSAGKVLGHEQFFKYGINNSIDTGIPEDIISQGGNVQILSANDTASIVSTSANDTSGGSGTNSVIVFGVDQNMNRAEEIVTLNGTTPVSLTKEYIAIWRIANFTAGSNRLNEGAITITADTGAEVLDQIEIGKGSSLSTLMVVPNGYTLLIYDVFISLGVVTGSATERKGIITARSLDYDRGAERVQAEIGVRDRYTVAENFRMPLSLPEKQFVWFRADDVSANGTPVQASYTFELIKS